jgi:hypothetical protein
MGSIVNIVLAGLVSIISASTLASDLIEPTEYKIDMAREMAPGQISWGILANASFSDGTWAPTDGGNQWVYSFSVPSASQVSAKIQMKASKGVVIRAVTNKGAIDEYSMENFQTGIISLLPAVGDVMTIKVFVPFGEILEDILVKNIYGVPRLVEEKSTKTRVAANGQFFNVVNAMCEIDSDIHRDIRSTILLVISNDVIQTGCTGTLVNNNKNPGAHYIMTAAHCGNTDAKFEYDGATVTAHWGATSSCGDFLRPYSSLSSGQTRATSGGYQTAALNLVIPGGIRPNTTEDETFTGDIWVLESAVPPPQGVSPVWAGITVAEEEKEKRVNATVDPTVRPAFYALHHPGNFTMSIARIINQQPVSRGGTTFNAYGSNCLIQNPGFLYDCAHAWYTQLVADEYQVSPGSSGSALRLASDGGVTGVLSSCSRVVSGVQECDWSSFGTAWDVDSFIDIDNAESIRMVDLFGGYIIPQFVNEGRSDNLGVLISPREFNANSANEVIVDYITDFATSCVRFSNPETPSWDGETNESNGALDQMTVALVANGVTELGLRCSNAQNFSKTDIAYVATENVSRADIPLRPIGEPDPTNPSVPNPTPGGAENGAVSGSGGGGSLDIISFAALFGALLLRRRRPV